MIADDLAYALERDLDICLLLQHIVYLFQRRN
jgi:hypothetical protein